MDFRHKSASAKSRNRFQHLHFGKLSPGTVLKILFEKNKIPDSCQTTKTTVYVLGKDASKPVQRDYCTVGATGRLTKRRLTLKRPRQAYLRIPPHSNSMW